MRITLIVIMVKYGAQAARNSTATVASILILFNVVLAVFIAVLVLPCVVIRLPVLAACGCALVVATARRRFHR